MLRSNMQNLPIVTKTKQPKMKRRNKPKPLTPKLAMERNNKLRADGTGKISTEPK